MRINGFIFDSCSLGTFITSIIFLLFISFYYISFIPLKTSFDNPEIIFIFDENLNKKIEENVKAVLKRKIYGIIGLFLIFKIITITLIKIYILCKAEKKSKIDEKLLISQINQ